MLSIVKGKDAGGGVIWRPVNEDINDSPKNAWKFCFEVECCLEGEGFSTSFGMLSLAPEGVSP